MAQTILDKCLDELEARLVALVLTDRSDGLGAQAITCVTRDPEGIVEGVNAVPYICMECDDPETPSFCNVEQMDYHKPIKITLIHEQIRTGNAENLPQNMAEFLRADLIRGILTNTSGTRDLTLGGNCIITTLKAARTFSSVLTAPHLAAQVLVDIWYRTKINDPYTIL